MASRIATRRTRARNWHPAPVERAPRRAPDGPPGFDRRYRLDHCEGFRVESSHGPLGFVERTGTTPDGEPTIEVRAGLLGRRILVIPASSVAFIVPRAEHIWLSSPLHILSTRAA